MQISKQIAHITAFVWHRTAIQAPRKRVRKKKTTYQYIVSSYHRVSSILPTSVISAKNRPFLIRAISIKKTQSAWIISFGNACWCYRLTSSYDVIILRHDQNITVRFSATRLYSIEQFKVRIKAKQIYGYRSVRPTASLKMNNDMFSVFKRFLRSF